MTDRLEPFRYPWTQLELPWLSRAPSEGGRGVAPPPAGARAWRRAAPWGAPGSSQPAAQHESMSPAELASQTLAGAPPPPRFIL